MMYSIGKYLLPMLGCVALMTSCEKEEEMNDNYQPVQEVIDLYLLNDNYYEGCANSLILDAGVDDAEYLWSPGGQTSRTIEIDDGGWYFVQISTVDSAWTDSLHVNIQAYVIFIPNAFSPNGDGINDLLYVYGNCIMDFYFVIYQHSNSNKLFEANGVGFGWDGSFKGKPMPAGEYPFRVEATFTNGSKRVERGTIQLIR